MAKSLSNQKILIIAVVLIVVIALVVFFVNKNKEKSSETNNGGNNYESLIQSKIDVIKKSPDWDAKVREKALAKGIPYYKMIRMDAIWVLKNSGVLPADYTE